MEQYHSSQQKPTIDDDNAQLQTKLLDTNNNNSDHHKGGLRTMPFIIVNETFANLASTALMPNMIFYLMEFYNMEAVAGTTVISIWSALSDGLSIFGAYISDSYLGRFRVIAIGSFSTLLGMTCLWLTSMVPQLTPSCQDAGTNCSTTSLTQISFLLSSFGLISIGSGCIKPCSIAFGADQLKHYPTLNTERVIESYFNWYYASSTFSSMIGLTFMVYIQDQLGWQVGFAVPALVMVCSALMFIFGSSLYVKVKVSQSPFSGFLQVLVIALKNRKIILRPDSYYNHSDVMEQVELTENLRFLNKACVVNDMNMDSSGLDSWSVSTVETVESLKSLIRIIPIWSSSILINMSASQSFPTLQANTMNRHITSGFEIPAGSFTLFIFLTLTIWILFYDRVLVPFLVKYRNQPRGLLPTTRMGIGILIAVVALMVSAIVETIRLDVAMSLNNPDSTVEMSAMWLVPQFALFGLAVAFNAIGQIEFYYSELPKSMSSIAIALLNVGYAFSGLFGSLLINLVDLVTSQGGRVSWLASDINKGHLDYYYWFLSFLNLLNFVYFLFCCRAHRSNLLSESRVSHEVEEEGTFYRH